MKQKIKKMIRELDEILLKYEDRIPVIKGIKNLTRDDLEDAIFRLEQMYSGPYHLSKLYNQNLIKLFDKYEINPEYNNITTIW